VNFSEFPYLLPIFNIQCPLKYWVLGCASLTAKSFPGIWTLQSHLSWAIPDQATTAMSGTRGYSSFPLPSFLQSCTIPWDQRILLQATTTMGRRVWPKTYQLAHVFLFLESFSNQQKLLTNCKMHSFLLCRKYILMYSNCHDSKCFIVHNSENTNKD
jgi:hypothetical protein